MSLQRKRLKSLRSSLVKRKLIKVKLILFLIFLILICYFFYLFLIRGFINEFFSIKGVELIGEVTFVSKVDLEAVAKEHLLTKNILTLDTRNFISAFKNNFLVLSSVSVKKSFPNKILVNLIERRPIALIKIGTSEALYVVDGEGFVLGIVENEVDNLPVLFLQDVKQIAVGDFVGDDLMLYFSTMFSKLGEFGQRVSSVTVYEASLSMILSNQTLIVFPRDKKALSKVYVLKEVIKKYQLLNIYLKKVDLRYDNVVVEY
ncbi:MAG: FtsQ-type POTRA domain-containing protein [Patescibacteria group bacterium]